LRASKTRRVDLAKELARCDRLRDRLPVNGLREFSEFFRHKVEHEFVDCRDLVFTEAFQAFGNFAFQ